MTVQPKSIEMGARRVRCRVKEEPGLCLLRQRSGYGSSTALPCRPRS